MAIVPPSVAIGGQSSLPIAFAPPKRGFERVHFRAVEHVVRAPPNRLQIGDDAIEPERIERVISQRQTIGIEPQRAAVLNAEDHRVRDRYGCRRIARRRDSGARCGRGRTRVDRRRRSTRAPQEARPSRSMRRRRTGRSHRCAMLSSAAAVSSIITGHIGSRNRRYHHASNGW